MPLVRSIATVPWRRFAILLPLTAVLVMSAAGPAPAEEEVRVPRWEPHDFAFRSQARPDNPFLVAFSAVVRGPHETELIDPGFYDGEGTWKVRVSPSAEGRWSLVTRFDEPSLDDQRAAFVCSGRAEGDVRGALRVDAENPHHFVWEDGSRFFLMGYDENGSTHSRDWHGFTKHREPVAILGSVDGPPFEVVWDLSMLAAQEDVAVRAVVHFRNPENLRYRTTATGGLEIPARADAAVRLFATEDLPRPFWSRAKRAMRCTVEVDVDPAQIERAELHVVAWGSGPGEVEDYFTLNGHRLPIPASGHDVQYTRMPIEPRMLREGTNTFGLLSDTEHHGIEILRPGPALVVRYRTP